MRSSFEGFIEMNLMVQSKFNLIFWFVSYNIFLMLKTWGPPLIPCFLSRVCSPVGGVNDGGTGAVIADALHPFIFSGQQCIACVIPAHAAVVFFHQMLLDV
jgi:hypothetical protein